MSAGSPEATTPPNASTDAPKSDPQLHSGERSDHRDCHIKPDLVLIYRKPDETSLELIRLGSHSELGL